MGTCVSGRSRTTRPTLSGTQVGERGVVAAHGQVRYARVLEVRRTRVTVEYRLADGAPRRATRPYVYTAQEWVDGNEHGFLPFFLVDPGWLRAWLQDRVGTLGYADRHQTHVILGRHLAEGSGQAEALRLARIDAGLGLRPAANALEIPPRHLSDIEHGRALPTPELHKRMDQLYRRTAQ